MEIRSEITGLNGEKITIVASDPQEYINTINVLTAKKSNPPKTIIQQTLLTNEPKRRKYIKLSQTQLHEMKKMKRDGNTPKFISMHMSLPYKTVLAKTRSVKPKPMKTDEEKLAEIRHRHMTKYPVYHINCPACFPECGKSLDDWLKRSKQARTNRIKRFKKDSFDKSS
jgi:hypothetical protein